MSDTLSQVIQLVEKNEVRVSEHGYDELAQDNIYFEDVLAGVESAILIEDYPNYYKGPSIIVFQRDYELRPIHVVWGIPKVSLDQVRSNGVMTSYGGKSDNATTH